MNIISMCKNFDFRELVDIDAVKILGDEIGSQEIPSASYQVILSDDAAVIKSFRTGYIKDFLLLVPMVAILKRDSTYSAMARCITSGATALIVKIQGR